MQKVKKFWFKIAGKRIYQIDKDVALLKAVDKILRTVIKITLRIFLKDALTNILFWVCLKNLKTSLGKNFLEKIFWFLKNRTANLTKVNCTLSHRCKSFVESICHCTVSEEVYLVISLFEDIKLLPFQVMLFHWEK